MTRDDFIKRLFESESPIEIAVDRLLLRIFDSSSAIIQHFRDVAYIGDSIELEFNKLPDVAVEQLKKIAQVPIQAFLYEREGRDYTGIRINAELVKDKYNPPSKDNPERAIV